ncbi:MAG: ABC transporter permease subunit [Gammaproteobacteria bacterium]|nr:ABC transporter permease subunit [Gammaproteobacteria bacterium]
MILNIAKRELRSMFLSPLAWTVLAVTQLILCWIFFSQLDVFFSIQKELTSLPNAPGVTDLVTAPLLEIASVMLLMISPLLTMRLISEERRNGTLTLLLSSPISIREIVLGKFLGITLFYLILIAMISLMPLSLMMGTELDLGKLASGLLGLLLLLCAFAAAGLFLSSLTANPGVAAISTFGLLLLLWILERSGDAGSTGSIFTYLSLTHHITPLLRGIVNTTDLAYFALFIITFLLLTIRQMDAERLQG